MSSYSVTKSVQIGIIFLVLLVVGVFLLQNNGLIPAAIKGIIPGGFSLADRASFHTEVSKTASGSNAVWIWLKVKNLKDAPDSIIVETIHPTTGLAGPDIVLGWPEGRIGVAKVEELSDSAGFAEHLPEWEALQINALRNNLSTNSEIIVLIPLEQSVDPQKCKSSTCEFFSIFEQKFVTANNQFIQRNINQETTDDAIGPVIQIVIKNDV